MNTLHVHRASPVRGFTLVEMVVAITISAVVIGMAVTLVGAPVDSYFAQTRRSALVDSSDRVSRTLLADFDSAVPNSIRIRVTGNTRVLQLLTSNSVLIFQDQAVAPPMTSTNQTLNFAAADNRFYAFGRFSVATLAGQYLVINPNGLDNNHDPYRTASNVLLDGGTATYTALGNGNNQVDLSPSFKFRDAAASGRLYVASPVTYVCNLTTRTIRRFAHHVVSQTTPANESAAALNSAGATNELVATGVTACTFSCSTSLGAPGLCGGTVSVDATLQAGVAPNVETMRVFQQAAVEGTP